MKQYYKERQIIDDVEIEKYKIRSTFSLFKYRSNNDHSLADLLNDELTISKPSKFNDPYDSLFWVSKQRMYSAIFESNKVPMNKDVLNLKAFRKDLSKIYNDFINGFAYFFKSTNYVSSFSETPINEAMWAHYAPNGFVLEYKYTDIQASRENYLIDYWKRFSDQYKKTFTIEDAFCTYDTFKIKYKNHKPDLTDLYIKLIKSTLLHNKIEDISNIQNILSVIPNKEINDFNTTFLHSSILVKNIIWRYEKEWRLILPSTYEDPEYNKITNIKPVAIYVRKDTPRGLLIILTTYCISNNIPIFVVFEDNSLKKYGFKTKRLSSKTESKNITNL